MNWWKEFGLQMFYYMRKVPITWLLSAVIGESINDAEGWFWRWRGTPNLMFRYSLVNEFSFLFALEFELKKYDKSLSLNDAREFELKIWQNMKRHELMKIFRIKLKRCTKYFFNRSNHPPEPSQILVPCVAPLGDLTFSNEVDPFSQWLFKSTEGPNFLSLSGLDHDCF